MQSPRLDVKDPRGFAGLAALGVPVDDLLTDVAVPTLSTGQRHTPFFTQTPASTANPNGAGRRTVLSGKQMWWAVLAVIISISVLAVALWRTDNAPDSDVATRVEADTESGVETETVTALRPPIGDGQLLSRAEIQYCLAEEVRLQAARNLAGTGTVDVAKLNGAVSDLNARCGSFQYQGNDLALAEADVQAQTASLIAEGEAGYLNAGTTATSDGGQGTRPETVESDQANSTVSASQLAAGETEQAEPSQRVRDIQWLLFKLGLYEGEMSGLYTSATQAAHAAFLNAGGHAPSTDFDATLPLLKKAVEDSEAEGAAGPERVEVNPERDLSPEAAPEPVIELVSASQSEAATAIVTAAEPTLSSTASAALLRLADADRLAIDQLCKGRSAYADCVDDQLVALESAPNVALTPLSAEERRHVLSTCGPLRSQEGPAAYYLCKAELAAQAVRLSAQEPASALATGVLPQNVLLAIGNRCESQLTAGEGEHARCVSGQFANLSESLNPLNIASVEFSERAAIETVCSGGSNVSDVAAFHTCVGEELDDLQRTGAKPDMQVASFAHRKDIETACQVARLTRGPAEYYRCLSAELTARGY